MPPFARHGLDKWCSGAWFFAVAETGGFLVTSGRGAARWMEGFAARPAASVWLFAFAFAESSFFPIPPDILLIALCLTGTALASLGTTMWYAAVCTVASALGGAFGYALGRGAGRPLVFWLSRWRITRAVLSEEKIRAAEGLLQRYDVWAVGAAGFTPIPYKVFTIASGVLRVRFVRFLAVSVASRGARFFLVAALCHAVGESVKHYLLRHLWWATVVFFAGLVGGFYVVAALGRRMSGGTAPEERDGESNRR